MTSNSQTVSNSEAERLVVLTRMDRLGLFGLQQFLLLGQKRNEGRVLSAAEKRAFDCVQTADSSIYVGPLSEEIAKQLSLNEMREAIRFFESDAGRKLVESDFATLTRLFSGEAVTAQGLSATELDELDQFKKTPAGKKILVNGVLNLDPIANVLAKKSEELGRACARAA